MLWIASTDRKGLDRRLTREDLVHHPIISYEAGSPKHQRTLDYLGPLSHEAVIHSSNAMTTTIPMIETRVNIAVLPPIVIHEALRDGRLRVLELNPFPVLDYDVVWSDPSSSPLPHIIARWLSKHTVNSAQFATILSYYRALTELVVDRSKKIRTINGSDNSQYMALRLGQR